MDTSTVHRFLAAAYALAAGFFFALPGAAFYFGSLPLLVAGRVIILVSQAAGPVDLSSLTVMFSGLVPRLVVVAAIASAFLHWRASRRAPVGQGFASYSAANLLLIAPVLVFSFLCSGDMYCLALSVFPALLGSVLWPLCILVGVVALAKVKK